MIYLFYYLHKKLNKTNSQIRNLKVKNDTFNRTGEYHLTIFISKVYQCLGKAYFIQKPVYMFHERWWDQTAETTLNTSLYLHECAPITCP